MNRLSRRALTGTAFVVALAAAGAATGPAAQAEDATIVRTGITTTWTDTYGWRVDAPAAPGTTSEISPVGDPFGRDGSLELVTGTPATAGASFSAFVMYNTTVGLGDIRRFDFVTNASSESSVTSASSGIVARVDLTCNGHGAPVTLWSVGGASAVGSGWDSVDARGSARWTADVYVEPDGTTSTTATGAEGEIGPDDAVPFDAYAKACAAGYAVAYGVGWKSVSGAGTRGDVDQIRFNDNWWEFGSDTMAGRAQTVVRAGGSDRIATAVQLAQVWDAGTAGGVVLARSDQFADGLTGAALAAKVDGPVLITRPDALRADVLAEIQRVLPQGGTVYLLGGTAALGPAVENAVSAAGFVPQRISGTNRYDTAVAVANAIDEAPSQIFVTTGADFPDALSAGAAAGVNRGVLVLTNGGYLPAVTREYLGAHRSDTTAIWAIGGPAASALGDNATGTFAGFTRYDTALQVATFFFDYMGYNTQGVLIASGENFPDALGAGAVGARLYAPVLLTKRGFLHHSVDSFLETHCWYVAWGIVAGAPGAVDESVRARAQAALADG